MENQGIVIAGKDASPLKVQTGVLDRLKNSESLVQMLVRDMDYIET